MGRPKGKQRALKPRQRGNRWIVVTRESGGERHDRSFAAEADAWDCYHDYNALAAAAAVTLEDALERYQRYYLRDRKPGSWNETRRRIVRLMGGDEQQELATLSARKAAALYEAMVEEGLTPDTHQGMLTHTKTFWKWCVKQRLAAENPWQDVERQGRKKKGKLHLTVDEARLFRDECIRRMETATDWITFQRSLMALIALYMGAGASEITQRRVRDIDADCTLYLIPFGKTEARARVERIPAELQPFFQRLIKDRPRDAFLFPSMSRDGRVICHEQQYVTRHCVRPITKALKLPDVTAHGLRGTAASGATEHGMLAETVSRWLGHAEVGVTRSHYIGREAEAEARSKRKFEILEGGKKG